MDDVINYAPKKYRFSTWSGNPNGVAEDLSRCFEEVSERDRGMHVHQCYRKRGYGYKGLFCKQHAKRYLHIPDETDRYQPSEFDEYPVEKER